MAEDKRLPGATSYSLKLRDGRTLAYDTFAAAADNNRADNVHPVLYLHGFVGCGVEGAWLAEAISKVGGKLYAIDRPGFGYTDPMPAHFTNKDRFETLAADVFEMAKQSKWKSFSLIGVSGGGPYILAILDAYLRKQAQGETAQVPELKSVHHVCGVCSPAGTEGMLPFNVRLTAAIDKNTLWARILIRLNFVAMRTAFAILPIKFLMRNMKLSLKDPNLPRIDALTMMSPKISFNLIQVVRVGLRQGSWPALVEAQALFSRDLPFADSLREQYAAATNPPRVFVYQGRQDINVPYHHGRFVHEEIFQKKSNYCELEKYGHVSLVVGEQDRIANDVRSCF
ncbi:MAG: hypothetical protein SGILL_005270 [Bacillariaceae sp.]